MIKFLDDIIPILGIALFSIGIIAMYGLSICFVIDGIILMVFGIFINLPKRKG